MILFFIYIIWLTVFVGAQVYQPKLSNKIYRFDKDENSVYTSSWNKTYVFSGNLISDKKITNIYLELEIETPLNNQNQILFGLKKEKALYYNIEQDTFNAEYIDSRGYYMRKQYYRLEIQQDESIKNQDQYYITIFQNTPEPQELKYSLKMIIINHDNNASQQKYCPFNCLNRGQCNRSEGSCVCDNGFVDYDCSKPSTSISSFSSEQNKQGIFEWDLTFKNSHNGQFYHILDRDFDGYLYLQIFLAEESITQINKKTTQNQLNNNNQQNNQDLKESLEVFYTLDTKNLKGIGVADKKFAKQTQTLQIEELYDNQEGIEIFLDEFHANDKKENLNIEVKEIQQMVLLGFRLKQNITSDSEQNLSFKIKLVLKDEATHGDNVSDSQLNSFMTQIKHNETIVLLFVILFILICVLIGLLLYVRKHSILIAQTQQQRQQLILNKKLKKEEEFRKVFDLIARFTYSEENKKKYWPNLKNACQQEGDESEQPTCSICLCEFSEGEEIRVTYCPHFFHEDCLREWIKKQKNCPHCRNELIQEQPKIRKKSSRSSPSQIIKSFFQQISNTPDQKDKKNKNGYDQQIDEISNHLEPLESAAIHKSEQRIIKQDAQNVEVIQLNSNIKVVTQIPTIKQKGQLQTQNSFKIGSQNELDQSAGDFIKNTENSFTPKMKRKSFKRKTQSIQLSKFSDPKSQSQSQVNISNIN